MSWLSSLSRVAFICNLFFLIAFSVQLTNWVQNETFTSMIVILGYIFVFVLNPVVNLCYLIMILFRMKLTRIVPAWLVASNVLFLVIQLFYILYINK
jgi:hypothetical protein